MLDIWTENSGYSFGIIQERTSVSIALPTIPVGPGIEFSVISGKLPPGLRIQSNKIVGSAFEVPRDTEYKFVIRATEFSSFSDRTFSITVSGADIPEWNTTAGALPVGPNDAYYILDSSYIDFQLSVIDTDTASGQELKYFIPSGGGELPPGLILTDTGRIVGWVQPVLAPPLAKGNGRFDRQLFDEYAYDYGLRPNNGYDSYIFDLLTFDFGTESLAPKKLNRNFEFNIIVTDGDSQTARKFRIFVVGDDFFRADNTVTTAGNNTFTADITYARAPIWTTPNFLGTFRANNYKTFKLDTYEALVVGPIVYSLESVNPDVFGVAFTTSLSENKIGTNTLRLKNVKGVPLVGHRIQLSEYVEGASYTVYTISSVTKISDTDYLLTIVGTFSSIIPNNTNLYLGTPSVLPPGMLFDPTTSEVFGVLPYQTAITKDYNFTIKATRITEKGETASSKRIFTARIIGEIDSTITWNTDNDLGSIGANYISTLKISASTTFTQSPVLYFLISGQLPPGLSLNFDGEIVGKVTQFENNNNPGLILFDQGTLTLDDGTTSVDRSYSFEVEARDVLGYSATRRIFTIHIETPNDRLFSNLIVKPFLKVEQRNIWKNFINNPDIFDNSLIYRPSDLNFGIQKDLKMLVFAGIETKSAAEVVGMTGRNHKPKRFKLGAIKNAIATTPFTDDIIYEVVYLEVIDPLEIGKKYLPSPVLTSKHTRSITVDQNNQFYEGPFNQNTPSFTRADPFLATVDRSDVFAGDSQTELKFPSSISIWRNRIKELGLYDSTYLPLWMRSIQLGAVQPLGYITAIPICYCKPGTSNDIVLNIKNSGFDFSQIDYTIDRYIIDSVTGYNEDKYIAFRNDRTTIS
jgi:hypothetical protein